MKICPACQTRYTDDTLKFCLQDGTPLAFGREVDTPTAVLNETETLAARVGGRLQVPINDPNAAAWQQSQMTRFPATTPPASGSNTALIAVLAVVAVLAVLGLAGLVAWTFLRNSENAVVVNTPYNSNVQPPPTNANFSSNPSPPATPTRANITSPPGNAVTTSPPVDKAQISSEVQQKINNWKSMTESKDMSGLRTSYAPVLDYYYNKRNVSSSSVITDKERAFRNYSSMRVNVSNMSVTTDPSGEMATVVYNKDWSFNGIKPFCGVIRSQMELRKVNGVWLIVGERDVPGTFRRTC